MADDMRFITFCNILEKVKQTKGIKKKAEIVKKLFTKWREVASEAYSLVRLLLPELDSHRYVYGLRERALAQTLMAVLSLDRNTADGKALLNFRSPAAVAHLTQTDSGPLVGDFPAVASCVVGRRTSVKQADSLTLRWVNTELDRLHRAFADVSPHQSKRHERKRIFATLIRETTQPQFKWLLSLIMKDLKLGISKSTIFKQYHSDAIDLYNTCTDLERVCSECWDPERPVNETGLSVFIPFKPMLCHRPVDGIAAMLAKHLFDETFQIEPKLDGERILIHFKRGEETEFRYFSRRPTDYTRLYGKRDGTEGKELDSRIKPLLSDDVQSCILDGEMMPWDTEEKVFEKFGTLKSAAKDKEDRHRPCFVVFDIVLLNGETLVRKGLAQRREILGRCVREELGTLHIIPFTRGSEERHVVDALERMSSEEGIVIKHLNAPYLVGQRELWVKFKHEYFEALRQDLDLVVVGGILGTGRRSNQFSRWLLALRDGEDHWSTFAIVGTGYSLVELEDMNDRMSQFAAPYDPRTPPHWLSLRGSSRDRPDAIVHPQHSFVMKVFAAEIVESSSFASEVTLRFPRCDCVREDKDWTAAATLKEIFALKAANQGRLRIKQVCTREIGAWSDRDLSQESDAERGFDELGNALPGANAKRLIGHGDFSGVRPSTGEQAEGVSATTAEGLTALNDDTAASCYFAGKKRKRPAVRRREPNIPRIAGSSRALNETPVDIVSTLFEGLNFCVLGSSESKVNELRLTIASHSGETVASPPADYVVATDTNLARVRYLLDARQCDILKPAFVVNCLRYQAVLPVRQCWAHFLSPRTSARLELDALDDSPVDVVDGMAGLRDTLAPLPSPSAARTCDGE